MATLAENLTDAIVNKASILGKRYYIKDLREHGPHLHIFPSGIKSFYLHKKYKGESRKFHLGDATILSVRRARDEAKNVKVMLAKGIDPADVKKAARAEYTMQELFDAYIKDKDNLAMKTIQGYLSSWTNNIQPLFGKKKISDITFEHLQDFHKKYSRKAPYGANRCIMLIKAMFNYATVHGFYHNVNPAKLVILNEESPRIRALEKEEIGKFLSILKTLKQDHQDVISILLFTGVRKFNVFSMRWEDLDLSDKTWTIPKTKTAKNAVIPLSDPVLEILRRRSSIRSLTPWVFPADTQKGHITYIKKPWKKLLKQSGIENLRVHDLRHTLATRMIADGANTFVVQRALTHRSIQSTQVYVNLNVEDIRDPINNTVRKMQRCALELQH